MFGKTEEIDYTKLTESIIDRLGSEALLETLKTQIKDIDINKLTYDYTESSSAYSYGVKVTRPLIERLASSVASDLARDLYELRKLEILKQVGTKEIIAKLEEQLADEINKKIDNILK